jgi:peptide/nickel transport system ATP-binding protein
VSAPRLQPAHETDGPGSSWALEARGVHVETVSGLAIVEDLSLALAPGEILAVVGESGSGKTTAALSMLGYARAGARITAGSIRVQGEELIGRSTADLRHIRGRLISYVPQDPATALNPSMRIGDQVVAVLRTHLSGEDSDARTAEVLSQVGLPNDKAFRRRFPHQLSGGQQQRVAIAVALACRPSVVVFDEPTTALDVVTQRTVLDEIRRLRDELGIAMMYVSHDLAVVASIADRIAVFYAGRLVEVAPTARLLSEPLHPYTRALLAAVPEHAEPRQLRGIPGAAPSLNDRPMACAYAPRCPLASERSRQERPELEEARSGHFVACHEVGHTQAVAVELPPPVHRTGDRSQPLLDVQNLVATYPSRQGPVTVCHSLSFRIPAGTSLAVVGESGSGKTTLARCIAGLHARTGGVVGFAGEDLAPLAERRTPEQRRRVQMIFQNPYGSLNPAHTVGDSVGRAAVVLRGLRGEAARAEARDMLERVRLSPRTLDRYPGELSGGERQRVAIARALVAQPDLLICDEITSALDVSVQAAVVELLESLRVELSLSLLFISHDLAVVSTIADSVMVLEHGHIREQGDVRTVLAAPRDDYTRRLVAAVPRLHDERTPAPSGF